MTISKNQLAYPKHLVKQYVLSDGKAITIRPARADDAELIKTFSQQLSSELKHVNYMENFKELPENMVKKLIQIDYKKVMTLLASYQKDNKEIMIGMVHYVADPDGKSCEFDMIVTDAWQNKGIGRALTQSLIDAAKDNGMKSIKIIILASNRGGMMLAKHFGFVTAPSDDPSVRVVIKNL